MVKATGVLSSTMWCSAGGPTGAEANARRPYLVRTFKISSGVRSGPISVTSRWAAAETGRGCAGSGRTNRRPRWRSEWSSHGVRDRSGRLRASRRVPLDTITDAILVGSSNSGYSVTPSLIPKPRAEVRVLPGALSSSNRRPMPILDATQQRLQRPRHDNWFHAAAPGKRACRVPEGRRSVTRGPEWAAAALHSARILRRSASPPATGAAARRGRSRAAGREGVPGRETLTDHCWLN